MVVSRRGGREREVFWDDVITCKSWMRSAREVYKNRKGGEEPRKEKEHGENAEERNME